MPDSGRYWAASHGSVFSLSFFFFIAVQRNVLFKKVDVMSPFGAEGCQPSLVVFNH